MVDIFMHAELSNHVNYIHEAHTCPEHVQQGSNSGGTAH